MGTKVKRDQRLLRMFKRLYDGHSINTKEKMREFHVDARTIRRDIADIRAFLSDLRVMEGEIWQVIYDKKQQGYVMENGE